MSRITTHVLDLTSGRPAAHVAVRLHRYLGGRWRVVAARRTDEEGRIADLLPAGEAPEPGFYRLRFGTSGYYRGKGLETFHPFVDVTFQIRSAGEHYHVPLQITPHGYSTYRGN
ncbi:hydroxyisourate hydrolase [Paracidobacterium acidisoli]|uniref:5-hydroxyisourate hydrolase n=1 Tax=Paracidobacterium acidisoli TaxID=2303751 RepID=A0A372IUG8_9BACT|nr:hydroxyisourate hydrolase [Paracidobacterium acidisoli]MBT9329884.1 hydroxyisourate hydrolase [Paracidobacterium acidisoli]